MHIGSSDTVSHLNFEFCPLWDRKLVTSQRLVMLCGWGVKTAMAHPMCG